MNVELLRQIVAYAEAEPRRFNMETWYEDVAQSVAARGLGLKDSEEILEEIQIAGNIELESSEDIPPCGAVACLSGTACILSGRVEIVKDFGIVEGKKVVQYFEQPISGSWFANGRDALGLTDEQACRLFYPGASYGHSVEQQRNGWYWPDKFAEQYHEVRLDPKARFQVLKARVEHFIATEGRE